VLRRLLTPAQRAVDARSCSLSWRPGPIWSEVDSVSLRLGRRHDDPVFGLAGVVYTGRRPRHEPPTMRTLAPRRTAAKSLEILCRRFARARL